MGTDNCLFVQDFIVESYFPLLRSTHTKTLQATRIYGMCAPKQLESDKWRTYVKHIDTTTNDLRYPPIGIRSANAQVQLPLASKLHLTVFVPRLPVTAGTVSNVITNTVFQYFMSPRLLNVNEEIRLFCQTRTYSLSGRLSFSLHLKISRVSGGKVGVFRDIDNFLVCSEFTKLYINTSEFMHSKRTLRCKFDSQQVAANELDVIPIPMSRFIVSTNRPDRKLLTASVGKMFHKISSHELCLRRTENMKKSLGVSDALSSWLRRYTNSCTLICDTEILSHAGISIDKLLAKLVDIDRGRTHVSSVCYNSTPLKFAGLLNKDIFVKLRNNDVYNAIMLEILKSSDTVNSNCTGYKLRQFFDRSSLIINGTLSKDTAIHFGQISPNVLKLIHARIHEAVFRIYRSRSVSTSTRYEQKRDNKLQPEMKGYSWSSVGGHDAVKKVLTAIFQLPLKYRQLFKSCRSIKKNVLLFGPPGTGKTLIAKVIASQGNMKFICVKGPEILNMYVGESERLIREVFRKASENVPCLLFFDEIESIAPRKHGVDAVLTSRIVSQLSIELDISHPTPDLLILGATNRPDLIDVSILRPNRFDRLLYVGIDTTLTRRVQLLETLTRHMNLPSDFKLENVAQHCNPICSGADVYGACVQAWISAVKRHVHLSNSQLILGNDTVIRVSEEDLITSITTISPTLSESELKLYDYLREVYDTINNV